MVVICKFNESLNCEGVQSIGFFFSVSGFNNKPGTPQVHNFLALSAPDSENQRILCNILSTFALCLTGTRRSRNRGRGQILLSNTKPSTLQFEADFDFETANAQFNKDDLEKEIQDKLNVPGMYHR